MESEVWGQVLVTRGKGHGDNQLGLGVRSSLESLGCIAAHAVGRFLCYDDALMTYCEAS